MKHRSPFPCLIVVLALLLIAVSAESAYARDAAFLDPGAQGGGDEAVKVDPKAEIDIGDTPLNVAKRTSIFFVNETNIPVKIEKIVVNGDSNVTAEATADDCMKQGTIDPLSRCSVEISATPTSPGTWSVDVLMTHNGAGRIARARVTGKTSGAGTTENKSTGLAVSAKETKPIDFGDVTVGDGKTVRSTLMVNDSPEPITIYAIDVIEANNGLQRLEQGCAVDMELAPGASCPVTLLWVPLLNGPISTDLIIRHSGKLGFAVIPIRGAAKGGDRAGGDIIGSQSDGKKTDIVPLPPSAKQLEKEMAGKIAPISGASLGGESGAGNGDGVLHLIGTVGESALFLKSDGDTAIVPMGATFDMNGRTAKLVAISSRSADVVVEGKRKSYALEAAASLVAKAAQQSKQDNASNGSGAIASSMTGEIKK